MLISYLTECSYDSIEPGRRRAVNKTVVSILTLLIFGFLIRSIWLDAVPPALNSDELLKAFDGASVWRTGNDHHGAEWPLFFKQSGAGLFAAPFGMNAYTVRLPSTVLGTMTILFTFLYVRELWGQRAGLLAALLVTFSPWNVHYSRLGWEAISYPPLLLAGLWLFTRWTRQTKLYELLLSAFCFSLTFYSYPAARLYTPLILIALVALHHRVLWNYRKQAISAMIFFVLITVPYAMAMLHYAEQMQARWKFLSIFQQENPLFLFVQHYFLHLSPWFLFVSGDSNPLHSMPGGLALLVLLPLFLFGLIFIIRFPNRNTLFLLFWFLTFAIPSSLTFDRYNIDSMPNALRATCGLGMLEIISVYGLFQCYEWIKRDGYRTFFCWVMAIVLTINGIVVGFLYISVYPKQSAEAFQYGLREFVEYIEAHKQDYEKVVVSPKVRLHPVSLATFAGMPPQPFDGQDFPKYVIPFYTYVPIYRDFGMEEYQKYGNIGRWYTQSEENILLLVKPGEISVGEPVFRVFQDIENHENKVLYEIYENRILTKNI